MRTGQRACFSILSSSDSQVGSTPGVVFYRQKISMIVLVVFLGVVAQPAGKAAVKFTSLFSFNGTNGATPEATLVEGKDGYLYGTTLGGGTNKAPFGMDGTIFRITTNGAFATLAFLDRAYAANPQASLIGGSDGNWYGTTQFGGPRDWGAAFRVTPEGAFSILGSFEWPELEYANGLVEATNGLFYGTGYWGGTNGGYGSIFSVDSNGVVALVVSFGTTNGANPQGPLVRDSQGNFYGTTVTGGSEGGWGTVFQLTADGKLVTLVSFNGTNGANPMCPLHLEDDGTLYGITSAGARDFNQSQFTGNGTIFKITPQHELVTLHTFAGYPDDAAQSSFSGLFHASDGNFYGTSQAGGANGSGTIFRMSPDGTVQVLYSFTRPDYATGTNADGWYPSAGVIQASDGNFYGVTMEGGPYAVGTVFRFSVIPDPPVLRRVAPRGNNLTLSWDATSGAKYQVQYATDLNSPNWIDLGPAISATNSVGSISDAIGSSAQRFYRVVLLP